MFDIPNFLEACGFCGAGDLVEGEATIGGFENAFAIYIGAIGSAFACPVINFVVVKGVGCDAGGHHRNLVFVEGLPVEAAIDGAPKATGDGGRQHDLLIARVDPQTAGSATYRFRT